MKIKMIETDFIGVGIDVPEDLEKARQILDIKTLLNDDKSS